MISFPFCGETTDFCPGYEGLAAHLSTKGRGKGTWFDPAPGLRTLHPQGRAPEPRQLTRWYTFQQLFLFFGRFTFLEQQNISVLNIFKRLKNNQEISNTSSKVITVSWEGFENSVRPPFGSFNVKVNLFSSFMRQIDVWL